MTKTEETTKRKLDAEIHQRIAATRRKLEAEKNVVKAEARMVELEEDVHSWNEEANLLRKEKEELRKGVQDLDRENFDLRMKANDQMNKKLNTENNDLKIQLNAQQDELRVLKGRFEKLSQGADASQHRVKTLENENARLKRQVESLEVTVENAVQALNEFKKRVRALGNEV